MSEDTAFDELMMQVRAGDQAAEAMLFRHYVVRLIALAARQFDAGLRERADVETVVLSACKSFFLRNRRGEFVVDDFGELWTVLAMITVRKCENRRRHLRAARRDAQRELNWLEGFAAVAHLSDRAPDPVETAMLNDTIAALFDMMSPEDESIVKQLLLGYTACEVATRLGCSERTVRRVRQRAQRRLERLNSDCDVAPVSWQQKVGPDVDLM